MRQSLLRQIQLAGLVRGDSLLVGVSGGVDSVVLLHLLHELGTETGLQLQVAHLDHQIRPESSADADFVRQLCAEKGLPCLVECCAVQQLAAEQKLSLEMAARQARREFLQRAAAEVEAAAIVLAHHRDDQVETFFQRLVRGSGTSGLTAMRSLQGQWWRPLLECSREQILVYAAENGLTWVEDASNADPAYLRNRLRHQFLPQLRELNPQLDQRWQELCRQLQDEDDYWTRQVEAVFPLIVSSGEDGLRLQRDGLLALPRALRVRVLREALRQLRGDLQRLEAVHLSAIDGLLSGERSQAQLDLPGCWVARRYQELWFRNEAPILLPDYQLELPMPGELQLPCGRIVRTCLQDEQLGESLRVAEFSVSALNGPLVIRNWRAGDSFSPEGMQGTKLLKCFFGDEKVELEERRRVPLLVSGATILWLLGRRRSGHATAGQNAGQVLRLELV
ncbi:MAG TPA: tRNA lysidine(34) synthetase TilS [Malonomonas sp.]